MTPAEARKRLQAAVTYAGTPVQADIIMAAADVYAAVTAAEWMEGAELAACHQRLAVATAERLERKEPDARGNR